MKKCTATRCMIALLALIVAAGIGTRITLNRMDDNFHEVVDGILYRSAQPSAADIHDYAHRYGIRTIVNLRDEAHGVWYRNEKQAAAAHGITLIDFPISSSRLLPVSESERLAGILRTATPPVLIHCEHGVNRTGLATAIYLDGVLGLPEWLATTQISPYFGHIPIPHLGRYQMFRSWHAYAESDAS